MDNSATTTQPLVSVIVLTYNQEATVGKTLDSVIAQRARFPFEIVVGEDSSTDATRSVCEKFAKAFPGIIRLMPAAPRKGITANYFDCLRACRGKYIADCSGDDTWAGTSRLADHIDLLEKHPEYSAVAGDWIEDSATHEAKDRPSAADFINALAGLPAVLSAATYRADLIRPHIDSILAHGYPCEDLPIFLRLAESGEIVRHAQPALIYNTGNGTVSRPKPVSAAREYHARVIAMRLSLIRDHGLDAENFSESISRRLDHLVMLTFRLGAELDELRRLIADFGFYSPSARSGFLMKVMLRPAAWRVCRRILAAVRPVRRY